MSMLEDWVDQMTAERLSRAVEIFKPMNSPSTPPRVSESLQAGLRKEGISTDHIIVNYDPVIEEWFVVVTAYGRNFVVFKRCK